MPPVRNATHAGSWYSSSAYKLDKELATWLSAVGSTPELPLDLPLKGCKAVIAPHAGYSYSGPPAGWAYRCVDVEAVERVFILGPSHHVYLTGCALSRCTEYATPLGSLPLDLATIAELEQTGKFEKMSLESDEEEHSIEMHLPYLRKIFASKPITIVPILVGSLSLSSEKSYGALLAPYLASPSTLFVISSDFCHWGSRFSYTYYQPAASPSCPLPPGRALSRINSAIDPGHPIHRAIEQLDRAGMEAISFGAGKSAKEAHEAFAKYLKETSNTICGRHPIGVLLGAMAKLEEEGEGWEGAECRWVRYAQSSAVEGLAGSSVSYASGFVRV